MGGKNFVAPARPAPQRVLSPFFAPRADRPIERPPQIAYALDEAPPPVQTAALATQQIAIQAIYLILPALVGAQFGLLPIDIVNFLALSVAVMGIAGLLQALPRGPIGSGYPVPSIPSPVFVAAYLMAAPGGNLVVVGTLAAAAGLAGMALAALLRRLQAIVPTEVAGVVVFLIGISLLPRAFAAITAAEGGDATPLMLLALGTLATMIAVALVGGRLARFAVLIGVALGTATALLLGIGVDEDHALLARAPWFALPRLEPPALDAFDMRLVPAFLVALLASFASWAGDLVAFQRAADRAWLRPDTPPIRRGLLAQSAALTTAGLLGGMVPGTSSACVGLAIGTRILARRVAVWASLALLLLACCPKAMALVVLLPDPVEAAMLGYVCCFMLAAGCQLMTSRMLDVRRTFTTGMGIAMGIGALLGLGLFAAQVPQFLRSPVTTGAAVAILLNLLTAPLVTRRASFELRTGGRMTRDIDDRVEALGGAWGARRETMRHFGHSLLELAEVLAGRGVETVRVQARHADDQVALTLAWSGEKLPEPSRQPGVADLDGPVAAQEAFAVWLATRNAESIDQRPTATGWEMRLVFVD